MMNKWYEDSLNALLNEAHQLLQEGYPQEAMAITNEILATEASCIPALTLKTAALLALKNHPAALNTARRTLQLDPQNLPQLIHMSLAYQALGDIEGCLAAINQTLAIDPRRIEGYIDKSAILLAQDRYEEALETIRQGLAVYPRQLQLLINQSTALLGLERYEEALATCNLAITHHGKEENLLCNRVLALSGLGCFSQAVTEAKMIAEITEDPGGLLDALMADILQVMDYPAVGHIIDAAGDDNPGYKTRLYHCCARHLLDQDRMQEALDACETILANNDTDRQAYALKGRALARLTRFQEANNALQQASRLSQIPSVPRQKGLNVHFPPDTFLYPYNAQQEYVKWQLERLEKADWSQRERFLFRLPEIIQTLLDSGQPAPLTTHSALHLPLSPKLIHDMAKALSRHISDYMAGSQTPNRYRFSDNRSPRLIRIGYVSADFRDHATSHLIQGMFRLHDRNRFEIIGYSLHHDDDSVYRRQISADCDHFIDLTSLSNAAAAQRIHEDKIDILVDLMGFTYLGRPEIFALRPAPIQVSYLGYPGTLGADFIQYIIADCEVLPEYLLPFFSEQPVYLPDCYQVTHRQIIAETGICRSDVGLPEDAFVFCCFNRIKKIEPTVFEVWMRLLKQVPDSVLWLLEHSALVCENLWREALKQGVEKERIVFAKRLEKSLHLERLRLADLFLDTFIYNAHTTASDALWAGLPILTRQGDSFQSRVAGSLLKAIGLPELITHSTEEYERMALYLANHRDALDALGDRLQHNRLSRSLFDTERFVKHLERAFEAMWANYAAGHKPRPIHVERIGD